MNEPWYYYPKFLVLCERKINSAHFLSALVNHDNTKEEQWICMPIAKMKSLSGMGRKAQDNAIRYLKQKGYVSQKNMGLPSKRHFQVNRKKLKNECKMITL